MSQSPFQEQNVPVIEVCCLCGRPLSGLSTLLFSSEQGQANVDEECARALRELAVGWEPGRLGEALRYVQTYLSYTHPAVHGFLDPYIARGLRVTGMNGQPSAYASTMPQSGQPAAYASNVPQSGQPSAYASNVPQSGQPAAYASTMPQGGQPSAYASTMPQGGQPAAYLGAAAGLYPVMRQDGQAAARPGVPPMYNPDAQTFQTYDEPQAQTPAAQTDDTPNTERAKRSKRAANPLSAHTERLFRVLARAVFAAIIGLAAALLSTRGASVPALPLVLGAWLAFAYTGGFWLFTTGYRIGMRYTEIILYPDGDPNLVLKSTAAVLSVLFSLLFTAIVGAINGVVELFNTAFKQNVTQLYAEDNPAHNHTPSNRV